MKNEYGVALDRAGYAPSIIQPKAPHVVLERVGARTVARCALCGRSWGFGLDGKLDRHEPWGGANRKKSMALGMWVLLCHTGCHEGPGSVHDDPVKNRELRKDAQRAAMLRYGFTREQFIERFGKSELSEDEAKRLLPKSVDKPRFKTVGSSAGGFRIVEDEAELPF